ncbi:DUF6801 domain-containing protein [Streptomyces sp. NPDC001508]|uniref:DUF6801 domain-containing protein n=1 Tax=Streptomyces sp. NPDC001508 TaxID=3154656 RepID=UPI0033333A66
MRGPRAAVRRPSRARARGATIAAFVVLAATVPAAAVAAGIREVDTELPYVCTLPSGQRPVTVRVSAAFPDRVAAGEPIRPADVTTTVEFPAQAVADLAATGAPGVRSAETRLTVAVAQNDATAEATWRGTAQPVVLPTAGPLTLTATGDVPTVTGRGAGELTLSAADFAVDLALGAADDGAAEPAALTVECALAEDAPDNGLLAAVPVGPDPGGPDGSPSASPSPSGTPTRQGGAPADRQRERSPRVSGDTPGGTGARPDAPPCRYDARYPAGPMSLNAYITGYANVRKLKGAALIPLTCTLIEQGEPEFEFYPDFSGGTIKQHSTGDLYNGGRAWSPPFEATFLTFGFTPTKATMVLEQTGPLTIDSLGATDFVFTSTDTYVRVPLVLRVISLTVNGTPLEVGPNCRTEKPLASPEPDPAHHPGDHLVLHGRGEQVTGEPATGYLLLSGGPLTGEVTIPAFTGCGAGGERVDRLLTASVSGSGNYVKQMQGQTCYVAADVPNPEECTTDLQPLKIPVPER